MNLEQALKRIEELEEEVDSLEKGRYDMCEAVEKYAAKQSQKSAEASRIATLAKSVEMVMHNTSVSLEQAFDILEVVDKDRQLIIEKLAIIEK